MTFPRQGVSDKCDTCGLVHFYIEDITIRQCVDTGEASYFFRCPECEQIQVRAVHRALRDLLLSSGAEIQNWFLPLELFAEKVGPPITADDLLDFHIGFDADVRELLG